MIIFKKIISAILAFVMAMLSGFALPEEKKCDPAFTGSFIQLWATVNWSDEEWENSLENMKQCGLEYLIVQEIASKSPRSDGGNWHIYYDSSLPEFENAERSETDLLETILRVCRKTGIKVFVPLAMFDDFWTEGAMTGQYSEICDVSVKMAEEIYGKYYIRYSDVICGWYFTPELNNILTCAFNVQGVANGLNKILAKLTELDPSLPLLLSPFYSKYTATGPMLTLTQLVRFFSLTEFRDGDIYCPQDAVGAGWISVDDLAGVWSMYSQAVKTCEADVKLWANVESFTLAFEDSLLDGIITRPSTENAVQVPATLDRVVKQMEIASAYAENIITFSFNHFYDTAFSDPMFMQTYKDYVENGCVLEQIAPEQVSGLVKNEEDGGVRLSWNKAEDNFGVAYYRIEKDGTFLARVETFDESQTTYLAQNCSIDSVYTVTAFDAAGNASQGASI